MSSAFTYILRYPDDSMMKENMEYYESNGNVTVDMYFNMEPKKHLDKYDEGKIYKYIMHWVIISRTWFFSVGDWLSKV